MARVLLTTLGSLGDLYPYLALGKELKALGLEVTIATHDSYAEKVRSYNFLFLSQGPDWSVLNTPEITKKLYDPKFGGEYMIRELLIPEIEKNLKTLSEAGSFDYIFNNTLTYATQIYADKSNIPCTSVVLSPLSFFSKYDPPVLSAFSRLNRILKNPFLSKAVLSVADLYVSRWAKPIQKLRQKCGLNPSKNNPITYGYFSRNTLIFLPDFFISPQKDWPHQFTFTGFPYLNAEDVISRSSADFISKYNGNIVVYTLGSVLEIFDDQFLIKVIEFHKTKQIPALIVLGPNLKHVSANNSPFIQFAEYEPFEALFPVAKCIVHHGGIGTMAEAMRAGVPQIIFPFTNDQPENARRCADLGVAIVLDKRQIDYNVLSQAFEDSMSEDMLKKCRIYKDKIAENSFGKQIRNFIESKLKLQ